MITAMDRRARQHFEALSHDEKVDAIHWLQDAGFSDHGIAHATRLSIEQIRATLAERSAHDEAP